MIRKTALQAILLSDYLQEDKSMIMTEPSIRRIEMIHCALCSSAPCDAACPAVKPAGLLRSIWFDNEQGAVSRLPAENPCLSCNAPCEKACVRPGQVGIRDLITKLYEQVKPAVETAVPEDEDRLACSLCGIRLENPFLLSSSVVASTYDMCARAFEAGWAGAAFKTICSFDIHEASPRFSAVTGDNGSIIGFKNIEQLSDHSVAENMEIFRKLKKDYPSKVILASIMGRDDAEWESLAGLCEENGADAVELNFSCPNMADGGLGSDIGQVHRLRQVHDLLQRRRASGDPAGFRAQAETERTKMCRLPSLHPGMSAESDPPGTKTDQPKTEIRRQEPCLLSHKQLYQDHIRDQEPVRDEYGKADDRSAAGNQAYAYILHGSGVDQQAHQECPYDAIACIAEQNTKTDPEDNTACHHRNRFDKCLFC